MTTIKETAQAYEPPQTVKNIAELKRVSIDANTLELEQEFKGDDGKPEKKTLHYARIEGELYYMPKSVLKELKLLLTDEDTSGFTHFKVIKTGTGMDTTYKVVMLPNES